MQLSPLDTQWAWQEIKVNPDHSPEADLIWEKGEEVSVWIPELNFFPFVFGLCMGKEAKLEAF